jgi:hypothetical protein
VFNAKLNPRIPNVAVIYPNEDTAIDRTLSLESEPECL